MKIGEKIAELRKQKGITQEQLGADLNVSPAAVSKWETSNALPDILTVMDIADYFEITTDELLGHRTANRTAHLVTECPTVEPKLRRLLKEYGIALQKIVSTKEEVLDAFEAQPVDYVLIASDELAATDELEALQGRARILCAVARNDDELTATFGYILDRMDGKCGR